MPRISLVIALTLLIGGAPATAARIATPEPAGLPRATAPLGLATVPLPDDEAGVEALFTALPDTVAGERQASVIERADRIQVPYGHEEPGAGHPLVLSAVSFADGDFFPPDFTAGDYVAMVLGSSEEGMATGGRDGDLVWVRAELDVGMGGERPGTPEASETWHTLAWGEIDGGWIFTAIADTPDRLEALVTAFVAASGGRVPATPGSAGTPAG